MSANPKLKLIEAGDVYSLSFSFSQEQVNQFAQVTGDTNPLHLDAEYAATTMFKKPIMHGFLGGSVFSRALGTSFPGEGTIYMNQSMAFKRPMYVDTDYEMVFTVQSVDKEKHRAVIRTEVREVVSGKTTIDGEATVINIARI
ncbi:MAG: MaoC family dehydratase [Bernardetiaceae bacterium]|nr:MaoC family dehydratase [Bernardetiaceae bacterium]